MAAGGGYLTNDKGALTFSFDGREEALRNTSAANIEGISISGKNADGEISNQKVAIRFVNTAVANALMPAYFLDYVDPKTLFLNGVACSGVSAFFAWLNNAISQAVTPGGGGSDIIQISVVTDGSLNPDGVGQIDGDSAYTKILGWHIESNPLDSFLSVITSCYIIDDGSGVLYYSISTLGYETSPSGLKIVFTISK